MVYFVSDQRPLSINAKKKALQKYKDRLKKEFSAVKSEYQTLPLNEDDLYTKLVYIHLSMKDIDIDNMSKPFVDAFKGEIYPDDSIINHRTCSAIKFEDLALYEIRLNSLPGFIADKLNDLITRQSQHILYFEVGLLSSDMVYIGGEP